jgi:outer membrane protein assembly factor BamB
MTALAMVGCATDQRPADIPSSAMNKAEGDQKLVYTASDPGTIWISEGVNNIVYSAPVAAGDRVVVDPGTNKILLNGQVVLDKDVNRVDHTVFFLPGATPPPQPNAAVAASERALNRPDGVPATAMLAGEGTTRVEYTAQRDGFIWITDADQHTVLYSAPVNRGDIVIVDPQKNLLTINGQSVYSQPIAADNHRIFFGTERPIWQSANREETIVRPADVPSDAANRVTATGRIDFVPERDGTVWIADVTTGRTIYSGRILANDRLTLDPNGNVLTLNGRPVHSQDFAPADRYSVFFTAN